MSQKTTRKGVTEEKEKRQTDSPVKEMKKKMAANAEKEKQAAATEKSEAQPEKSADNKQEKPTKQAEKAVEKTPEKSKDDKKVEKNDKTEKDKKIEKPAEKKEAEKPKDDKAEKSAKKKQNGHADAPTTNGNLNGTDADHNGTDAELNGRVSDEEVEHEDDEIFPELTYDDSEDSFEPPTPDGVPSRSFTRRSQAKATRTPETPRPASAKHEPAEDSKESKVLKMKDDPLATDRKLRSADSPKPESKKEKADKKEESQEKAEEKKDSHEKKDSPEKKDAQEKKDSQEKNEVDKSEEAKKEEAKGDMGDKKDSEKEKDKMEVEVIIDVDAEEGARKPDTNFSKSRVKVSPYRRSMRLADQTTSSVMANYTGNNTTMEMDISETSSFMAEEPSLDDSYLSGLRSIRGRRSYKPLKEMTLRSVANKSIRSTTSLTGSEHPSRPTGTVVGRKRKPDADDAEVAAGRADCDVTLGKRMRLLDRIAHPFRRTMVANTNVSRRAAEIVGINTDLPLTAPVASPDTFDPESLKPTPAVVVAPPTATPADRDPKRCVIM